MDEGDLDAILDQALEEFDSTETPVPITPQVPTQTTTTTTTTTQSSTTSNPEVDTEGLENLFKSLEAMLQAGAAGQSGTEGGAGSLNNEENGEDIGNDEFIKMMSELFKEMKLPMPNSEENNNNNEDDDNADEVLKKTQKLWEEMLQQAQETEKKQSSSSPSATSSSSNRSKVQPDTKSSSSTSSQSKSSEPQNEFERNIANTARMVSESAQRLEEESTSTSEEDAFTQAFSKLFEGGGEGDSNFEGMMEKFIHSMMDKSIMYEPLKDVCEKYPNWFETNKNNTEFTSEQMSNYQKQFDLLKQLLVIYDTTPNDLDKILPLMEEIAKCGSPPKGLVDDFPIGEGGIPSNLGANCPVM